MLHGLKLKTKRQRKKRVGRGGKRGTYSGRGIKGQKAHAGGRIRPHMRDVIKKIPKRRGYGKNRSRSVSDAARGFVAVNLSSLERKFRDGDKVTRDALKDKGVVASRGGRVLPAKILGKGTLTKKLNVSGVPVSKSAKEAIERAGGTVE